MIETRARLQARKEDLYEALRALERDRADGIIDPGAYDAARRRYEGEAADVLRHLDALGPDEATPPTITDDAISGARRPRILPGLTLAALLLAIAVLLVAAVRPRAGGTVTGSQPPVVPTPAGAPSAQLLAAQRGVRLHPQSATAWLVLGNVYLGQSASRAADQSFQKAMRLDPSSPQPATLHALLLGTGLKRPSAALALLARIEAAHPAYARAWLVDGLIASTRRPGVPRAIAAFRRFLALQPASRVSSQVRTLLRGLEKAAGR